LMDILARLEPELGITPRVLHYNYRIHDHAQEAYELVVQEADVFEFPVVAAEAIQPEKIGNEREGFEAGARSLRYRFFESVPAKANQPVVFLAHHRQDQVETILLNIGRGTGLSGLNGMNQVASRENLLLCRPLLGHPGEDIKEYAQAQNIHYIEDPSNTDLTYARNKLRHNILPDWREAQPDPDTAIARLGDRARRENQFWEQFLASNFRDWAWSNELQVDRDQFRQNHPAAQLRYVRKLVERLLGTIHGWSETNLQDLRKLFENGRSGAQQSLPGSVRAQNELKRGCLYRTNIEVERPDQRELEGTGEYTLTGLGTLTVLDSSETNSYDNQGDLFVGTVSGPLERYQLRTWNDGDRFDGDGKERILKSVFDENDVPYRARRYWPLLVEDEMVRCIPGLVETSGEPHEIIFIFRPTHPSFHQLIQSHE
jgi:tRNA(Ile)-lysidine synthetase-like protein